MTDCCCSPLVLTAKFVMRLHRLPCVFSVTHSFVQTCSFTQAHLGHTTRLQGLVAESGGVGVRCLPDPRPEHAPTHRDVLWERSSAHSDDLRHAANKQDPDCTVWVLPSMTYFFKLTAEAHFYNRGWSFYSVLRNSESFLTQSETVFSPLLITWAVNNTFVWMHFALLIL